MRDRMRGRFLRGSACGQGPVITGIRLQLGTEMVRQVWLFARSQNHKSVWLQHTVHIEQELPSRLRRKVEQDVAQQNAVVSFERKPMAEVALIEAAHAPDLGNHLPLVANL